MMVGCCQSHAYHSHKSMTHTTAYEQFHTVPYSIPQTHEVLDACMSQWLSKNMGGIHVGPPMGQSGTPGIVQQTQEPMPPDGVGP